MVICYKSFSKDVWQQPDLHHYSYCHLHQLLCFQYYIPFVLSQFSASKNSNTGFHPYDMPGTILSTLHVLTHLILTVAYEIGTFHEETGTEILLFAQGHTADNQQSQDINQVF